jgi:hypothetical protein
MRLGSLGIVLVASAAASAAPLEVASSGERAGCPAAGATRELLPADALAGTVRMFASPRGLDVFWTGQRRAGEARFVLAYQAFTAAGAPLGRVETLLDYGPRHIAAGDDGIYGVTYQEGTQAHVAVVRPAKHQVLWDVALPSKQRGHGTLAIVWDPRASQWVIAGEEQFQLPNQPSGYVYNRLYTARFDRGGKYVQQPTYLTAPGETASISDWGDPMTWTGDRAAIVWTGVDAKTHEPTLDVTELTASGATTREIARDAHGYTRSVLAAIEGGYVVASGKGAADPMESTMFVAIVRDGKAVPVRAPSSLPARASEPVIASDGKRVAIGWNSDEITGSENRRTTVHVMIVEAGVMSEIYATETPRGRHDWVQALAKTSCGFALAHTIGINPSSIQLVTVR